eukprot:9067078-Pyramimonas_sp.AAC.1
MAERQDRAPDTLAQTSEALGASFGRNSWTASGHTYWETVEKVFFQFKQLVATFLDRRRKKLL